MNRIGTRAYMETRRALQSNQEYKRLLINFEDGINKSELRWFSAKSLIEAPIIMLAAHYIDSKIENRRLDAELGYTNCLPRKNLLKREVSRFIYELNDEVANMEEEFPSIHEMSRWLDRFDKGNKISVRFRRKVPQAEHEAYEGMRDIVSVMIKVGGYSTMFLQSRTGRLINDSIKVHGPTGDMIYDERWERQIGVLEWFCRASAAWWSNGSFSWAIETDTTTGAWARKKPRRKHVSG